MKTSWKSRFRRSLALMALAGLVAGNWQIRAATSIPGGFYYPALMVNRTGAPTILGGALTIDAATERVAMICDVPKSGTIAKVHFRVTVTTDDTLNSCIFTVDGSGNPTSTRYGSVSTGTVVTAGTGLYTITYAVGATAVKGDQIAVVIGYDAWVAGNMNIQVFSGADPQPVYPYANHFTASWSHQTTGMPQMWLEYSDGTFAYIPTTYPLGQATIPSLAFNSGSTPDEYGLYFKYPAAVTVYGFCTLMTPAATASFSMKLYDTNGTTVLSTATYDGDGAAIQMGYFCGTFPSSHTLTANTYYRVSLVPTAVANITLQTMIFPSTSSMNQTNISATNYLTSRTDAGSWTEATSTAPFISLYISEVATGGGGSFGF